MDQITLAKAITDFGILVIIAVIFLGISVLVSKKILKDAAKDREKVDELNKSIQDSQQKQIDQLQEDVKTLHSMLNRQTPAIIRLADRAVKAIERMNECVLYCQNARNRDTPSPDDSDIEAIIEASLDATKTDTDRVAVEPKQVTP